ncbi:odorant receptor 131-2-like [Gambusia affinis]|uniref:odorant receptor 131-2-like n=1 Tax=Gambusia affinis TaxID=33528 RepID=UPI001CDC02BD|nr:odorant receptor 131-2-like [Gambusia affinis]XP_043978882.1 odorant receptor 131-2-like [Gambusia affinis]XP_043978883.1 odorant receptor 131-2-like [Gambusia affinis]
MNTTTTVNRDPLHVAILKNVITVVLSLAIIYINGTLIHIFRKHQVFQTNSRYILYIHLVINDIFMLALMILLQVLSYIIYTLNVSFCIIMLMLAISTSLNNPLTLAAMALECYLAICFPLRHPQICTVRKTYIVITVIWVLSLLTILPDLFIIIATRPAEYFHSRIFCLLANVFTNPVLTKKKDVTNILFLVIVWLILFYAYFRILFTAQAASVNAKKARNTVLLHGFQLLLCMLSYIHSISIEGLSILFPKDSLAIRYVISLLIQVMPRLISPMVYGIRDKMFRQYLKRYLLPLKSNIYPENVQKS